MTDQTAVPTPTVTRDPREPWPLALDSTAHLPESERWRYPLALDGKPRLRYVDASDNASVVAYVEEIRLGKIDVMAEGETPESRAAEQVRRAAESVAILASVNADEQAAAAKRKEEFAAWQAERRAKEQQAFDDMAARRR